MKNLSAILLLGIFSLFSFQSFSQSKEKEESKFKQVIQEFPFSSAVYVQEKNEIQQTGKYFHSETGQNTGNSLGYEFEYGILDGFQLSAGYKYSHSFTGEDSYHVHSFQAGTMLSFFNNSKNALALSIDADFPLNSLPQENEADKPSYASTFIYAIQMGKTQLHLNAGAELQNEKVTWYYNAAAVYGTGNWHPILELNMADEEKFNTYLGPGVDFSADSGWEISSGIRRGVNNDHWVASFKIIYEFTAGGSNS